MYVCTSERIFVAVSRRTLLQHSNTMLDLCGVLVSCRGVVVKNFHYRIIVHCCFFSMYKINNKIRAELERIGTGGILGLTLKIQLTDAAGDLSPVGRPCFYLFVYFILFYSNCLFIYFWGGFQHQ